MKNSSLPLLMLLASSTILAQSDNATLSIGIMPVLSIPSYGTPYTELVRDQIAHAFASKSRFTLVDRSRMDMIAKERNTQMSEDFISGEVVEQGKSVGAQFMVNCNISEITYNKVKTPIYPILEPAYTRLDLELSIGLNIQLIDIETGVIKSSKKIANKKKYAGSQHAHPNPESCIIPTISSLGGVIKAYINEVFPVEMKILRIHESSKRGKPLTVLITGGEDMDMTSKYRGSELEVYENEIISDGDRDYTRKLVVGKIRVDKVEGELSICTISSGHEAIQQKLDSGRKLYLRILEY